MLLQTRLLQTRATGSNGSLQRLLLRLFADGAPELSVAATDALLRMSSDEASVDEVRAALSVGASISGLASPHANHRIATARLIALLCRRPCSFAQYDHLL